MASIVVLKCQKLISVQNKWLRDLSGYTRMFYSPDDNDIANFDLEPFYYFRDNWIGCYEALVCESFGKLHI